MCIRDSGKSKTMVSSRKSSNGSVHNETRYFKLPKRAAKYLNNSNNSSSNSITTDMIKTISPPLSPLSLSKNYRDYDNSKGFNFIGLNHHGWRWGINEDQPPPYS